MSMDNQIGFYEIRPDKNDRYGFENQKEAMKLLDIIVAEFTSDPMSVQCFDLRIVERAKACVAKQRDCEIKGDAPPLLTEGRP